ncbi:MULTISPECIES: RidA family protein [Streptomyces]|uniref:RidA family protein n=1 Tax=Streptomyces evansiae TaxID=3075535 RepID=A0ABU2R8T8_9ACTN|nr:MULTISPECIES: RidA family protein [unclassified Streptomyces]MDT0412807.1 RidA family protein [Streptomyces sp. DSM 41979]MYQ59294.1 RidA family protein [Streptomyces sp. SID4926]SCD32912.1 Enamine deaminase RidA, house cleaning of reactive enamine intermediates, YjgF/YER057c/UK114 family [Streptomyces sp. DfronAA-171]
MPRHHVRPEGSPPVNGYSHAVAVPGPLVVVSGQVPLDAEGRLVGENDTEAQVRQVYANLATALEAAGSGLAHVVKYTFFLTDLARDLPALRAVRDEHQDPARPPASSLVQVAALVHPAFRVEIEALAVPAV